VAELEDAVRLAKAQAVREIQWKRDAEAARDVSASMSAVFEEENTKNKAENARLTQLVNGRKRVTIIVSLAL